MKQIEKAYLYIEKYSRNSHELLLDFILEREFLYFRNRGDYNDNMRMREGYEPTMLFIHNVHLQQQIYEGNILEVNMQALIHITYNNELSEETDSRPATVFMEIDGDRVEEELFDPDNCRVIKNLYRRFQRNLKSTWDGGTPCALNHLDNEFNVAIWDVGQGNTNVIYDESGHVTLFDFGTSIYNTQKEQKEIFAMHKGLFVNSANISLIISHWDLDHYNMLCTVEDEFLYHLCCVFLPPTVISLTQKQIIARIEKFCACIVVIPAARRTKRCIGLNVWHSARNYTIFQGEESRNKNKSGIALSLFGARDGVLLTADHTNYQVWEQMYNDLSRKRPSGKINIVVPHHGGKVGAINIKSINNPNIAAVSVGKNNYTHPNYAVLDQYVKLGFSVLRTDWERKDIRIHIS